MITKKYVCSALAQTNEMDIFDLLVCVEQIIMVVPTLKRLVNFVKLNSYTLGQF